MSANNFNVCVTSDLGDTDENLILKRYMPSCITNSVDGFLLNKITYFDNISGVNLFALIKNASCTISPHGTMTVMASYLRIPVVDIFEPTISLNSFKEFRPTNNRYQFLIIRKFSDKICNKIIRLLTNNLT